MKNLDTPILFLVFNRPHETRQVFETIRKIKPTKLFIAGDGPRSGKAYEYEICKNVREIATSIDWNCEVKTLFRDENLGCGKAVSEAITWFFDHVKQGIILEDDCICDISFFQFAELLLEKYKNDDRIMHISANGPVKTFKCKSDFSFIRYPLIWGWATWKRAWNSYDFDLRDWPTTGNTILTAHFGKKIKHFDYWNTTFSNVYHKRIDTWDYQWLYACLKKNGLSIFPHKNLVSNIGFGPEATHTYTKEHIRSNMPLNKMSFPIIYPSKIKLVLKVDKLVESEVFELNKKETRSLKVLKNLIKRALLKINLFS